jgi:ArsR family transcriptional regulator
MYDCHMTPSTLAARFHALSDPTRLGILQRLLTGERCVCELTDALDAAQSRLSFHLRVLRDAGLVRDRRAGRWVYYTLIPEAFEALAHALKPYAEAMPPACECGDDCCEHPVQLRSGAAART